MGITMIHAWVAMFFIFISFLHTGVYVAASQVDDLITLKSGFIDPNNNLNWNPNSVSPCDGWFYVSCTGGILKGLDLQNLDLSGELSSVIGQLGSSTIEALNLNGNNITGPIPKEVGSLTGLKFLNLYNNSFNGTIPDELGNLKNLEMLRLFNNSLSGKVPEVLSTLPNLTIIKLENNTDLCGWKADKPC